MHDPGKHINTGVHRDSKEAATDHYYRRKQHQKTRQERITELSSLISELSLSCRHPPRSQAHSAISEGHCLNCLTAYSPNTTEMGACTFHPGFLSNSTLTTTHLPFKRTPSSVSLMFKVHRLAELGFVEETGTAIQHYTYSTVQYICLLLDCGL